MDKSHIDTLIARWTKQGVALNPGASDEQFNQAEARLGIRFPDDVREFYRACNGFDTRSMDDELNSFLSVEEIDTVEAITKGHPGAGVGDSNLVIIDHCIWARLMVCRLTDSRDNPAPVSWNDGGNPTQIRPSFGDFIELYAKDPEAVLRDY